jgi:hypothetical protein
LRGVCRRRENRQCSCCHNHHTERKHKDKKSGGDQTANSDAPAITEEDILAVGRTHTDIFVLFYNQSFVAKVASHTKKTNKHHLGRHLYNRANTH